MAASHEGTQREADLSGASLVSLNLDYVEVLAQFRRADGAGRRGCVLRSPGHPGGAGPGPWLLRRPALDDAGYPRPR